MSSLGFCKLKPQKAKAWAYILLIKALRTVDQCLKGLLQNVQVRGRILGQNPDKSLKSFPPCYSQSPLQLCLDISIFF